MLDLKSDFYKRFSKNGKPVELVFCPAPLILFGTGASDIPIPETVLSLSFGSHCAFRARCDGRIILASSDTDTAPSVNVNSLDENHKIKDGSIFAAMSSLPYPLSGAELLLCSDVDDAKSSPEKLCALIAETKASGISPSAKTLLRSAHADARYMVSVCGAKAMRLNPATLDCAEIKYNLPGKKLVVAKISNGVRSVKAHRGFSQREQSRGEAAMSALAYNDVSALGKLMLDSGTDRLCTRCAPRAAMLFETASRLAPSTVRADFSGITAIVNDAEVDEFVTLCGNKYEKKTGTRPAFYISD